MAQWIDSQQPRTAAEQLRLLVLKEAHDAEFVLDLHCDDDSLLHIFTSPELMPELQDLADWMGAAATLTAADSGGGSFDEVLPQLYRKVAAANPGKPVPMASADRDARISRPGRCVRRTRRRRRAAALRLPLRPQPDRRRPRPAARAGARQRRPSKPPRSSASTGPASSPIASSWASG